MGDKQQNVNKCEQDKIIVGDWETHCKEIE